MSDYRAIAGITGTLQQFLYAPLSSAVPGTTVYTGPPSASLTTGGAAAVNIFLYQVNPNTFWRNAELPARRGDGTVMQRPQAALDLYYILSFYGSESKMVPQLLLGAAVSALHVQPMLDRASIPASVDGKSLEACGLLEQASVIKFTHMPLSHEELGRIWSVFFQVPYALSVAYQCSVVLLEADLDPEPALPVAAVRLGAAPWAPARLDRVEPPVVEHEPGAVIRLQGDGLSAPRVLVQFGDVDAEPRRVTDESVEVALPATLAAGVNTVRIVHRPDAPGPDASRSNPVSFVLVPRVAAAPRIETRDAAGTKTRMLRVAVAPAVRAGQTVELLLNEWPVPDGTAPRSHRIRADGDASADGIVSFPIDGVAAGDYLLRVEVDGVASRLSTDDDATSAAFGRYTAPRITV